MQWKVFFATFGLVFLAEIGDKTQIASLNIAAKSGMPIAVFLGSILAYGVVTLTTVYIGDRISHIISPEYIRYGSAIFFIAIGILMLSGKI